MEATSLSTGLLLVLLTSNFVPASSAVFEIRLPKTKHGYLSPPPLRVGCLTEKLHYTEPVCVPASARHCERETRTTLIPVVKKDCVRVQVPRCKVLRKQVTLKVCGTYYVQVASYEDVKGARVDYARRCERRNQTVCPASGYGYRHHHHHPPPHFHHCREEEKEVCFQLPIVGESKERVMVTHSEPRDNCTEVTTTVPRVSCVSEDSDEEFCYETLELEEGEQEVEECRVNFADEDGEDGNAVCRDVGFQVPKTVCRERPDPVLDFYDD